MVIDPVEQRSAPFFVAYVYPGWHPSAYRPGVNEWDLLDQFVSYFDGHCPPLTPVAGRYDDAHVDTVTRQIHEARAHGIDAFTYFLYYSPEGFVLDEPLPAVSAVSETVGDFEFSLTWCIRLPHDHFPIRVTDVGQMDGRFPSGPEAQTDRADCAFSERFIDELTLSDLDYFFGGPAP
jgi:hypothetical protein